MAERIAQPAPERASRISRGRVVANVMANMGVYALNLPIALLLSRYIVHRIGIGAFGIWATLTTIMALGGVLDLGLRTPLIKYVAEYVALGRRQEVNILLGTAMVVYAAAGAVFIVIMGLSAPWVLSHMFHANLHDGTLLELYLAVVVGFAVSLTFSVLGSLLLGLQRADLAAMVNLGTTIPSAVGTVVVLALGMGVGGLALMWVVTVVLTIALNWIIARRLFPDLQLNPLLFSTARFKAVLGFSTKIQVAQLTLFLNDQIDRMLIAFALGPSLLGYFQLAQRTTAQCSALSFSVTSSMLSAASDLSALNDRVRLRELCIREGRYLAILNYGLCAGIGGLSGPLVWAWLGPGFGRVALTMATILAGYAIWLPSQAITDPLNGLARPEIRLRADLAFLVLHTPLSIVLLWRFGYFGTIVGTTTALSVTRLYIYVKGPPIIGVGRREFLSQSLARPAIAALTALGVVAAPQVAGLPYSFPLLVLEVATFCAVYFGVVLGMVLDDYDRTVLHSVVDRVLPGGLFRRDA